MLMRHKVKPSCIKSYSAKNINDLPDKITSYVKLFADDTVMYLTVISKDDSQTYQQDLIKLENWGKTWEMHFNPSKCQVMHICKSPNPIKTHYVLHGHVLEAVKHAKMSWP